jgi:hypothetical protein
VNIDWTQAFVAGIAGGLIGGVAAVGRLVYRRLRPRVGRLVAALVSVVAVAAIGGAAAYSPLGTMAADYFAKQRERARIARAMSENMAPLIESPDFQRRVEGLSQTEANALAFRLSSEGLLRLPDEQLIARAHLLSEAVSVADGETCAAQLLGPTPEQAQRLLANLSDPSLREWAQISADASVASLRDTPRRVPSQTEIQEAFRRIIATLPEGEAKRLASALGNPTALGPADACWTARTIFRSFASLPTEDQALVARVLAVQ